MKLGVWFYGLGTILTGILNIAWGAFDASHQPIQALGKNLPGQQILAYILGVWLLAAAIGLPLDVAQVGGLVGLTTVAALVPVSVSGVATRDTMMVVLMSRLVQPASLANAQAFALSTLILGLNLANALFGYAVWRIEARAGRAPGRPPAA